MNLFLIVTLFIIIFSVIQGWRKGLLGVVFGFVSWIFIFLFVAIAHPYVETYIKTDTKIYEKVYEKTSLWVETKMTAEEAEGTLPQWWDSVTEGMPQNIVEEIQLKMDVTEQQLTDAGWLQLQKKQITQALSVEISNFIVKGIAVAAAFMIAVILVIIGHRFLDAIGKLPVIKEINHFLGIVAGGLQGILLVWVLMYVVACLQYTTLGQGMLSDILANEFLSYLYHHNLALIFISSI